MPRTEDGEFELVLGNKQLLSVFFIIVVLIGVFFAMGYIWGRSAVPVQSASDRNATPAVPRPDAPSAMAPVNTARVEEAKPSQSATETAPTQAPSPVAEKSIERSSEAASVSGSRLISPEKGQSFVQVMSMLAMPEAESLADVLAKKGMRSVIAPGPTEGKYRVMVGPVHDSAEAGKIKSELEGSGFKGTFLKKYE